MIVLGAGRIGASLHAAAQARGVKSTLISRDAGWEVLQGPQGDPILVCVRADDLISVVERVPSARISDLVLVQNGMLREHLQQIGLSRCTRGVLYFAATGRPGPLQPGGPSWFCGDHALGVVRWLAALDVPAQATNWAHLTSIEVQKCLWLVAFGAICDAYQCTVGEAVAAHRAELEALVVELLPVFRVRLGTELPLAATVDGLVAYANEIPDFRAGVKEWRWRHGWLRAVAQQFNKPMVLHDHLVRMAGKDPDVP